jgi:hypothetical protein
MNARTATVHGRRGSRGSRGPLPGDPLPGGLRIRRTGPTVSGMLACALLDWAALALAVPGALVAVRELGRRRSLGRLREAQHVRVYGQRR